MRPRRGSSGSLASRRPGIGELPLFRQRAELAQRALAVAHVAAVGRLDERKRLDVAELQRVHLQDDRGEIRALDLGLGECGPREEVLFGIQADRDARPDAAAAAGTLVRRGLRDLLDGQPLQPAAMAVAADARDARCRSPRGCPARSARSRRRWSPARRGGGPTAGTRAAALPARAASTAAAPRNPADDACAAIRRSRGSRARRSGTRGCRPPARATAHRRRKVSRPVRPTAVSSSSSSSSTGR